MRSELKKVVWPSKNQMINNRLVVLACVLVVGCVVVIGVFIWLFDFVAGVGINGLISLFN